MAHGQLSGYREMTISHYSYCYYQSYEAFMLPTELEPLTISPDRSG
jgi:hypothetical protein